jgi:hypothetical protein
MPGINFHTQTTAPKIAGGTEVQIWEFKKSNDKNLESYVLVLLSDGYKLPEGIARILWIQASALAH